MSEIPKGYKQTEIGIIPEDWEVKKLGEIGTTYGGLTGKKKEDFGTGNSYYIPFLNILMNITVDPKNLEKVYIKENETQNKVKRGDLFFNTSSETPEEVGMCAVLTEDLENTYLNSFCFGYRLKDKNIDGLSLSYFINSEHGRKIFASIAQGATRYNLSKQYFNNVEILIPPIHEQQAIAKVLSDIDKLIESIDKLIEKKKLIKKGVMQQLLTGKKRLPGFKGEWVRKKLGEVGNITGAGVDKKINKNEELVRLLNYMDVYKKDFLYDKEINYWTTAPKSKIEQCSVKKGDVFFTPSSELQTDIAHSAVAMDDMDNVVYSYHIIRLRLKENWDLKFRTYIFKTRNFLEPAEKMAEGSGKRYVISLKNFRELEIFYPSNIKEQQAIAKILSDMDAEIEALQKKKQKYEQIKKGAMQQLLTGKIRLKF